MKKKRSALVQIEARLVLASPLGRGRYGRRIRRRGQLSEVALERSIAGHELLQEEIEGSESLGEGNRGPNSETGTKDPSARGPLPGASQGVFWRSPVSLPEATSEPRGPHC